MGMHMGIGDDDGALGRMAPDVGELLPHMNRHSHV
jgi:hypothetical protein